MKPWLNVLTALSASMAAAGEGILGTKSDVLPTSQPSGSSMNLMPFVQMVVAVGIVMVLLKVWLPKILAKVNKGLKSNLNGGLRIEEAASFAGGTLNVVAVKGRTLLLCVGTQGVTFLADLTEPHRTADAPSFLEIMESSSRVADDRGSASTPSGIPLPITEDAAATAYTAEEPGAAPTGQPGIDEDEIRAALNRAKLLTA